MKRSILCAAFAALIVSGCGEEPKKTPPPAKPKATESKPAAPAPTQQAAPLVAPKAQKYDCKASPCVITVTVTGDCVISLDRDPVHVVKIKDAEMVWNLVGEGYEFVADGIRFKQPPAGNQFHNKRHALKKFEFTDKNSDAAKTDHPYGVKVKKTQGAACQEFDPVVVNEP